MMKIILTSIFFLITTSWLIADEADSFSEAKEMAAEQNKPILIDFWSDN